MADEVEGEGVDIKHYCPTFANTVDAHRVTELAYEKLGWKAGRTLHDRLIHAYYSEAMDIMNHDILLAEAVKVGLDEETVKKMLNDKQGRAQFQSQIIRQQSISNINGVPHFVINRFVFFYLVFL